ncbi:HEPN domain-containing protein [Paenibacillus polymyxa]|uniref:HEPN domain-containing protein n=2 Tax=Paenibacillus TaxID=44249 RepID=UPI00057818C8|nr:HEPN domain-containing protein [Paenibacillus polymyxa]
MVNKDQLKSYIQKVVFSGISQVQSLLREQSPYIYSHMEFPYIRKKENGFDEISKHYIVGGPKDYSSLFEKSSNLLDINTIEGFEEYLVLLNSDDYFKKVFSYRGFLDDDLFMLGARKLVINLIEAYIHNYGTDSELKAENFYELYEPIEKFIFSDRLYYDIYIPILFTKFEFEEYIVSEDEGIEIVKMDENIQLSRTLIQQHGSPISSSVLNGATHALKLKGFFIEGDRSYFDTNQQFLDSTGYPLDKINAFFNSMRIRTFVNELGYAQLLAIPVGWTNQYKAFLSSIFGTTIRAYPKEFENYYWLRDDFTTIDKPQAEEVSNLFNGFDIGNNKKLMLANRRLNMCILREEEDDSILDATIAMEALLSDGERGELTHKLAMRMAAIFKISEYAYTPDMVFNSVKKIYSYRSSIVHGGSKPKNQEIVIDELNLRIPTPKLAVVFLKIAIRVLVENPKYFDPKYLDQELLRG